MVGKIAVDFGVEEVMFAGQARGKRFECRAGGPVAGVPANAQPFKTRVIDPRQPFEQALDVSGHHLAAFDGAGAIAPRALGGDLAEHLDVLPEERPALEHHLEAIVIGGIMAAGYLDAAIHFLG